MEQRANLVGQLADADNAERFWCVYAWPVEAGITGNRVFLLNQEGAVHVAPEGYAGITNAPAFDAAYSAKQPGDMTAPLANPDSPANDGRAWRPLGY